jgi:hypothetical protein
LSPGPPVSSTNKTDRHDITKILLKVALNTIKPNQPSRIYIDFYVHYFSKYGEEETGCSNSYNHQLRRLQEAVYKLLLLHIQSFGIFHFRQRE